MKKVLPILLVLTMIFALAVPAMAAPAPVPGNPGWKAEYSKSANKGNPTPTLYDRGNASGDKISSNAHSADYPGLYFYWDDKQKDDGVLLVAGYVFDYFQDEYTWTLPNVDKKKAATEIKVEGGFILTAKNSNNYWGFVITKSTGKIIDTINGVNIYAYAIPKQIQFVNPNNGKNDKEDLKNINMVFIDGKYKDIETDVEKTWLNYDGTKITDVDEIAALNAALKFNGYNLGPNSVKVTDYKTALLGKRITVTETAWPFGFQAKGASSITKVLTWNSDDNVFSFENIEKAAIVNVSKLWFLGDEEVFEGGVALTGGFNMGRNEIVPGAEVKFTEIVPEGWELIDISVDGNPASLSGVDFVAARGMTYNVVFTNWQDVYVPPVTTLRIEKFVEDEPITDWIFAMTMEDPSFDVADYIIGFELYNVVDGNIVGDAIEDKYGNTCVELDINGLIVFEFETLPIGWYAVKELFTELGEATFKEVEPFIFYFNGFFIEVPAVTVIVPYASNNTIDGAEIVGSVPGGIYPLPETWNNEMRRVGYGDLLDKLEAMGAEWIWDNANTYQYGVSGSVVEFEIDVDIDAAISVPFIFAADNAAAVYVNGFLAGWTTRAMRATADNRAYVPGGPFGDLTDSVFDGGWESGWAHIYEIELNLVEGENTIIIVAANSKQTVGTGTPNDGYNNTNNPCGLIFGFEVPTPVVPVFNNYLNDVIPPVWDITLEKMVGNDSIAVWMYANGIIDISEYIEGFELYNVVDGAIVGDAIAFLELDIFGLIEFKNVDSGDYAIVEVLTDLGKLWFEDVGPKFITVVDADVDGVFVNKEIPPVKITGLDFIPSHAHVAEWIEYGIYCYAGNTMPGLGDYFVAFRPAFFDYVESVTISFEGGGNVFPMTFTKANFPGGVVPFSLVEGPVNISEQLYQLWFNNLHGTGSGQAFFVELVLQRGATESALKAAVASATPNP